MRIVGYFGFFFVFTFFLLREWSIEFVDLLENVMCNKQQRIKSQSTCSWVKSREKTVIVCIICCFRWQKKCTITPNFYENLARAYVLSSLSSLNDIYLSHRSSPPPSHQTNLHNILSSGAQFHIIIYLYWYICILFVSRFLRAKSSDGV